MADNRQEEQWSGSFGKEYTDRNAQSFEEMEETNRRRYGHSRTELYAEMLREVDRSARILEVGANIGNQLLAMQHIGFTDLCGIELQSYAIDRAKERTQGIKFIQASAMAIPFNDNWFDLVFTSGVLIHIEPQNLPRVMREMHRCSKQYLFGLEYFAETTTEVSYRGRTDLLWKANFAQLFLKQFGDLELIDERRLPYSDEPKLVDTLYLLRKK